MKRFLLDTGSASDYINRRGPCWARARAAVTNGDRVGTALPVVAELYAGVELSRSRDPNLTRLERNLRPPTLWPFDRTAAEEYGRIFATLRRLGRPIQQIDIQIASIAMSLGRCTVVTKDSDFAVVPELSFENWSIEE